LIVNHSVLTEIVTLENGVERLSQRQREILRLMAQHFQAKEVAGILNISEKTVRTHTEEARRRLGVSSSREAARMVATHEAGLRNDYRGAELPIPTDDFLPLGQGHEHDVTTERQLSDHQLRRTAVGMGGFGLTGETAPHRRYDLHAESAQRDDSARENRVFDGGGDGLADGGWGGRWIALKRWLRSRKTFQWHGLILGAGLVSVFLFAIITVVMVGALQVVTTVARLMR